MTGEYPSLKRAFRYCWAYRADINSTALFREIEDLNPDQAGRDILSFYTDFDASHFFPAKDLINDAVIPLAQFI